MPDPASRGVEPDIGADLLALIRARPERLISLTEISTLSSPARRRTAFRLEFAGGLTLKGRRLESPERAQRVERILGLAGDGFPRTIDRRGDALLLQWIQGRALASLDPVPPAALERCGRILGALHQLATPELPDVRIPAPEDLLAKLRRDTGLLADAGELDSGLGRTAVETAAALAPRRASSGVIHKDFCAENIVLDDSGSPVSIDNAALSVGPHDLDLARTWYRWEMNPRDRSHFLRGYERHRGSVTFVEHFAFWAICVLAGSASIRLRARLGGHREPLIRLRRLLEFLETDAVDHPLWVV